MPSTSSGTQSTRTTRGLASCCSRPWAACGTGAVTRSVQSLKIIYLTSKISLLGHLRCTTAFQNTETWHCVKANVVTNGLIASLSGENESHNRSKPKYIVYSISCHNDSHFPSPLFFNKIRCRIRSWPQLTAAQTK